MRLLPWLYALPRGSCCAGSCWSSLRSIVAWAGRGIYVSAIRALRHGATNMNTLVSLGTAVAFVYSAYATIAPAPGRQVYFDAVLLILGFLLLGKSLEARAKRRALAALDSLSRLRPVTARRIVDGVQTVVPLEEVRPGDSIVVLPGERFPVDATILEGRTTVDESMLTGESTPLDARARRPRAGRLAQLRWRSRLPRGIAGRGNGAGADCPHGRAGAELARAHGAARRPRQRHLCPRRAGPRGSSRSSAGSSPHIRFQLALANTVAVLVIACPCAMGLAVPAALTVAVGAARSWACSSKAAKRWSGSHIWMRLFSTRPARSPSAVRCSNRFAPITAVGH